MTCVLLATVMWVGQANLEQGPVVEPLPRQPAGLVVRLWIDSTRHRMYDPVYVRVTVTNTLDSAVMADCGAHKDQYTIQAGQFTYAYRGIGEYGVTTPRRMKPGDEWIVDYGILGFPPADDSARHGWDQLVKADNVILSATFRPGLFQPSTSERVDVKLYSNDLARVRLRVEARPDAETQFLESLFAERLRRRKDGFKLDRQKWGRPVYYPEPTAFGVDIGAYQDEDLIQRLFDFEEKLSPGSLRHALYLTRAMRALRDEHDTARRTKTVEELIKFIDTLPQIEREAVVDKLRSYYRAVAGDPASFLLCENLIQRLPKNIHGWDDFQAYQRREMGLDQPALREDVEGAKDKEN